MGMTNFTPGSNNPNAGGPTGPGGPGGMGNLFANIGSPPDPMELLIDYNTKFANTGKILFRDEVIQQTMGTLIGKNKPNALLIGSAGVGKTKIVEDLAYRLATKDPILPTKLQGSKIYELPLSNIVAGSSFVGQVEEKLKAVLEFICDPDNQAILFIDEIHQLCDSEGSTYGKIAQIMKPALSRGDIRVIGATTLQEAGKLMDDPALNRRFSRVIVDEFTREQTIQILQNARPGFMAHYANKIMLDDSLMETVTILADEYKPAGSHRPDNALTLLDRAIGDAIVARKVMEEQAKNDPALLQMISAVPLIPITEKQVKKTALRLMTGTAKKTDFDETAMNAAMSRIKGQDDAIAKIIKLLKRNDLALFPKTVPMTMLFAGSSGVGKTEIAKIIAQQLTDTKPIVLNMTEYHSPASINRIIGAPAGYIGSDSNAELPFDALESNPYQVILLDEFEKGDKSVQRLFMSAFDEGYIKTNRGKTIDFSRSIIIATTNAGHTGVSHKLGFNSNEATKTSSANKDTVKTLTQWFDTELLNRFQAVITFQNLDREDYKAILQDIYKSETARIKQDRPRIQLLADIPDDELEHIADESFVPEFGARPAKKAVHEFIENQV